MPLEPGDEAPDFTPEPPKKQATFDVRRGVVQDQPKDTAINLRETVAR